MATNVQTEQAIDPHMTAGAVADVMIAGFGDAVVAAIREHLTAGRAVYYLDHNDHTVIIKEMPDGRRFQVARDENGVRGAPCFHRHRKPSTQYRARG